MYCNIVSAFNTPDMVHHIQCTDSLPIFFSMFGGVFSSRLFPIFAVPLYLNIFFLISDLFN